MAEEWRWKVGDYINCTIEPSDVPLRISDIVQFVHPLGARLQRIVVDGPDGFEGTQGEFEMAGWQRVQPPTEPTP
jgi:hypothetical protein